MTEKPMSSSMSSPRVQSTLRIGPHNKDIINLIIASLLGNGSMENFEKGYRLTYYQPNFNGEYLLWLHQFVSNLGYCKPAIPQIFVIPPQGFQRKLRYSFRFKTYSYSSFQWIFEGFYGPHLHLKLIPSW